MRSRSPPPLGETRADGSWAAPFVPALFLDAPDDGATTQVVGHGPLHVVLRLRSEDGGSVTLTLVQGSPLVELESSAPVTFRVPGLASSGSPDGPDAPDGPIRTLRFATSEGPWMVAAGDPAGVTVEGDRLTVEPGPDGRFVLGPVPDGADGSYDRAAQGVAGRPLVETEERIEVAVDGTTTQVLTQRHEGAVADDPGSLWALAPHHRRAGASGTAGFGTVAGTSGRQPITGGADLTLVYPAVPVLWSAVALPDAPRLVGTDEIQIEGRGSYFGGKAAYAAAARADALRAIGDEAGADRADGTAAASCSTSSSTPRAARPSGGTTAGDR